MELRDHRVVASNIDPAADNKIHDDEVAQQFGFTGALVPGVELFAYATAPLIAAWGVPWLSGGSLSLRFRRPVYDGEEVTINGVDGQLRIMGPAGTERATGSFSAPSSQVPRRDLPSTPLPDRLLTLDELSLGALGSVELSGTVEDNEAYLAAVAEPSPLYRQQVLAHPGALLRLVNLVLMCNVDLGPWVHTASDARMLVPAHLPATMSVRAEVTDLTERNGSSYVHYDAVVLADDVPVMDVAHTAIYQLAQAL